MYNEGRESKMSAYQKEKRKIIISLTIGVVLALFSLFGALRAEELFTIKGLAIPFILVYPLGIAYSWRGFLYATDSTPGYDPYSYFTRREQRNGNGLAFLFKLWLVFSFGWIIGVFMAFFKLMRAKKLENQLFS